MSILRTRLGLRVLLGVTVCAVVPIAVVRLLAPVAGLPTAVVVVVLLALVAAVAVSLGQARRSLLPVAELLKGTRRIAAGDFDSPVCIEGKDELADLGAAFNEMAARLEERFHTQERAAAIDREILSSVDSASIAQSVLDLVSEVYPCQAVSLTVLSPHDPTSATTWMDLDGGGDRPEARAMLPAQLSAGDVLQAQQEPEWFELDGPRPLAGYLAHLQRGSADDRGIVVCPLHQAGELIGVLAVRDDPLQRSLERRHRLRWLADRVAIALGNARMMDQVRVLAFHDSLTRLPNRTLYRECLGQAIGQARASGRRVAVCSLDLDHFGRINDTLGPGLGDQLIQEVAARLAKVCAPPGPPGSEAHRVDGSDAARIQVARLGGDEFALVVPDLADADEAVAVARRVLAALQQPFWLGAQEVFVSTSIGIAVHPEDGSDTETLHQNADAALAHAKREGRGGIERYTGSLHAEAMGRMRLERELRKAVERGEFTMWYQPIVDLRNRWCVGAEALVRWDHPERGLVSPGEFMTLCEESGVIVPLGEWSLRAVCTQARRWAEAGFSGFRVSVNFSARQLRERGIVRKVQETLDQTGAKPSQLAIELTESLLMEQGGTIERRLRELAEMGIGLAIDDFGTGYSSLSYLKNFPVSTLKIDRTFIVDVPGNPDAVAITSAIIGLARALDLEVVAEGVETREQADFLRLKGCIKAQGFLLGRPAPVEMFTELLQARQRRRASA
ncbi:MAG: putative bifunctional diguanylate cyclase/phosphodiesterase [Gemmatimonadales bacterium]